MSALVAGIEDDVHHNPNSTIDHEQIVSMFLVHSRLRKVLSHLCNHTSGQLTDPISGVVHMMLTCPVQMVISEVRPLPLDQWCTCVLIAWCIGGRSPVQGPPERTLPVLGDGQGSEVLR
jgi:hypothetical protein